MKDSLLKTQPCSLGAYNLVVKVKTNAHGQIQKYEAVGED